MFVPSAVIGDNLAGIVEYGRGSFGDHVGRVVRGVDELPSDGDEQQYDGNFDKYDNGVDQS